MTPPASAAPAAPASAPVSSAFAPALAYQQSSDIGLRPEPFGALAYHFVTRRLVFLKSTLLVDLVTGLALHPSADEAIDAVPAIAAQIAEQPAKRTTYHKALASLLESGVIEPQVSP